MDINYEFKIDQRVQMCEGEEVVIGTVTGITKSSVSIQWEDLSNPVEHGQDEYHLIQLTKS